MAGGEGWGDGGNTWETQSCSIGPQRRSGCRGVLHTCTRAPPSLGTPTHTHVHTHSHTHAHTHTHTHTRTHTHTCACLRPCASRCAYTRIHTLTRMSMNHTWMNTNTDKRVHAYGCVRAFAYLSPCALQRLRCAAQLSLVRRQRLLAALQFLLLAHDDGLLALDLLLEQPQVVLRGWEGASGPVRRRFSAAAASGKGGRGKGGQERSLRACVDARSSWLIFGGEASSCLQTATAAGLLKRLRLQVQGRLRLQQQKLNP